MSKSAPIWTHLQEPIDSETLLTMEQVDQAYGYILYQTELPAAVQDQALVIDPVHDYAQVYIDHELVGTLDRHYNQTTVRLTTTKAARLNILVENTGRLNSTKAMRGEWKGIQSAVLGGKPLTGWKIFPLALTTTGSAKLDPHAPAEVSTGAHVAFGNFTLDKTGDAFLDVSALGKGVLWINGKCLGRFWNIGPQRTLYVPGPWLKQGRNDVVVFDMFAAKETPKLVGRLKPILDGPTPHYADDPERRKKADAAAEFGPKLDVPGAKAPKE